MHLPVPFSMFVSLLHAFSIPHQRADFPTIEYVLGSRYRLGAFRPCAALLAFRRAGVVNRVATRVSIRCTSGPSPGIASPCLPGQFHSFSL